jgi:hypothetical protein
LQIVPGSIPELQVCFTCSTSANDTSFRASCLRVGVSDQPHRPKAGKQKKYLMIFIRYFSDLIQLKSGESTF